jgi:hypothetical protein
MKPKRIQLSRAKGWRMPENTVKVDRTTKWGNPFVVGKQGTRDRCVRSFRLLLGGFLCVSETRECAEAQMALHKLLVAEKAKGFPSLRGKNLACWCPLDAPCHADVLLEIANA